MRKFVTAAGMAGLLALSAVPAGASPNDAIIPSVQQESGGATNACAGLAGATRNVHQGEQMARHGCFVPPGPSDPLDVM